MATPIVNKQLDLINERLAEIRNVLADGRGGTIYGFHINSAESDPSAAVTYLEDAVGMTPAKMDYTNGVFDYGSWRNAFFMPKPCMLKFDGSVDYYLNEADYTKKADGVTASDVADDTYGGNAMMEWGQNGKIIWYKIVPDNTTSASVYIADYQVDESYNCWSFIDANGDIIPHFYTPIYNGFSDSNNIMRSLSGKTPTASLTAQTERDRCRANHTTAIWDTEVYADNILISLLLVLMGKSLNTQAVFGQGVTSGGQGGVAATGTLNTKGLFWGSSGTTSAVKVFGMENFWGNLWRRFGGLVNVNGTAKYKMTRGTKDGSTANDYVISTSASAYSGYLVGAALPTASGTYVNEMSYDENQFTPKTASGSQSTYYCDALWTNNSQVDYACRGGASGHDAGCGVFYLALSSAVGDARWDIAASPSCKPLL